MTNHTSISFSVSLQRTNIVRHTQNLGLLKSCVDGFLASKGDYIVNLDPDDRLLCDLLKKLYSYLAYEDYDVVEYQYYWRHWSRELKSTPLSTKYVIVNRSVIFKRNSMWSVCFKCFNRQFLVHGVSFIPQRCFDISECNKFFHLLQR